MIPLTSCHISWLSWRNSGLFEACRRMLLTFYELVMWSLKQAQDVSNKLEFGAYVWFTPLQSCGEAPTGTGQETIKGKIAVA